MKRILLFFFLFFWAEFMASGQSAAELYNQANELREKGQLEQAIGLYSRVKELDKAYAEDCDYWIERIKTSSALVKTPLKLSLTRIEIPYQGGKYEVRVNASGNWSASCDDSWIRLTKKGAVLSVECVEENKSTRPRTTVVTVISGKSSEMIAITNEGAPEFLLASSSDLYFLAKGGVENIAVETNSVWEISSRPSWCDVQKTAAGLTISLQSNVAPSARKGEITISTPSGLSSVINVSQYESEQHVQLSKQKLHFLYSGGVDTIKVRTTSDTWRVADYSYWCNVKVDTDSTIVVACSANDHIEQSREGGIKVFTGSTYINVDIYQDPMPAPVYVPIDNVVAGRNVSFGLFAGYAMPIVSAKSTSNFTASVVNYSLGNTREQVAYNVIGGCTIGVFADVRLFRNLYLTSGLGYTRYSYKNSFDESYTRRINWLGSILEGDTDNQYEELYKFNMLDIPVSLSYRFPINDLSFISIMAGPTVSCSFNSQMELTGNTFSPYMSYVGHVSGVKPWSYSLDGCVNLLDGEGEYTELHTSANGSSVSIDYPGMISAAPYKKLNWGGTIGVAYELRGFAVEVKYYQMINNMANSKFWSSERMQIFTFGSDVLMSGYRQRNSRLMINLSYTFRYKKR